MQIRLHFSKPTLSRLKREIRRWAKVNWPKPSRRVSLHNICREKLPAARVTFALFLRLFARFGRIITLLGGWV